MIMEKQKVISFLILFASDYLSNIIKINYLLSKYLIIRSTTEFDMLLSVKSNIVTVLLYLITSSRYPAPASVILLELKIRVLSEELCIMHLIGI